MKRRVLFFLLLSLFVFPWSLSAQDLRTASPNGTVLALDQVPLMRMPLLDNEALKTEELASRKPGRAPHFAQTIPVDISPELSGKWEQLPGDSMLWRLRILSRGAYSLNLGFTDFHLPSGSRFTIFDPKKQQTLGPFSPADNDDHAEFWSPIILTDELVMEITLPAVSKTDLRLHLTSVNHDFMDFDALVTNECMLDAVCGVKNGFPEVENFRNAIQSVGVISISGNTVCTGFLVNNANQNCTPYFMTANHCSISNNDAASMVVYWNYQNSTCRDPFGSLNNAAGDGKFDIFNTGAIRRANSSLSDFMLLELDDPLPANANAYLAGWTTSSIMPTGIVAAVHQAGGLEKRISFSSRALYIGTWNTGSQSVSGGNHLIVPQWTVGSTEEGSSGGPLFTKEGLVIGQLHGGSAFCGNTGYDSFGWFRYSYLNGAGAQTRLQDWLDPKKTGITTLPGRKENLCRFIAETDVVNQEVCQKAKTNFLVKLQNPAGDSVRFGVAGLPSSWNARFFPAKITSGNTRLEITTSGIVQGFFPLNVLCIKGTDTTKTRIFVNVIGAVRSVALVNPQHKAKDIQLPLSLSWRKDKSAYSYTLFIARDTDFKTLVKKINVLDTTYLITQLPLGEPLYWRIATNSPCDTVKSNDVFMFTTYPDIQISASPNNQSICPTESLSTELRIGFGYTGSVNVRFRISPAVPIQIAFSKGASNLAPGTTLQAVINKFQQAKAGRYELTFYSNDNKFQDSTKIIFTLLPIVDPPTLKEPIVDAVLVDPQPAFAWETTPNARDYQLEISTDSAFSQQSLVKKLLPGTTFQVSNDLPGGRYFWRVKSRNTCAEIASPARSFAITNSNIGEINKLKATIEPIPTSGTVRLHVSAPITGAALDVFTISGQLLFSVTPEGALRDFSLDLSPYPSGVYLVRLRHKLSSLTQRVILQH
jgi:hypothetical protein